MKISDLLLMNGLREIPCIQKIFINEKALSVKGLKICYCLQFGDQFEISTSKFEHVFIFSRM